MSIDPYDLKAPFFFVNLGPWEDYNVWLYGYPDNQDDLTSWPEKTRNINIVPIQIYC